MTTTSAPGKSGMPAEAPLLDTHALLWWQAGSDRLSKRARKAIEGSEEVCISAISLWETTTLLRLGRIRLDRPIERWVADLLAGPVRCVEVDSAIAVGAGRLDPFGGDPADRVIYTTALRRHLPLITKDRRLTDHATTSGDIDVIW